MPPGTYDVVVTNPDGETGRLPQAFVVQPCLAYTLSFQFGVSSAEQYRKTDVGYLSEWTSSSGLALSGGATFDFSPDGGRTVSTPNLGGSYFYNFNHHGHDTSGCGGLAESWSGWTHLSWAYVDTPESLASLSNIGLSESEGRLIFWGFDWLRFTGTLHDVRHNEETCTPSVEDVNESYAFTLPLWWWCGADYPVVTLLPQGDGKTFAFDSSRTDSSPPGDLSTTWTYTCSVQAIRQSP
jgi:hypothetical protein